MRPLVAIVVGCLGGPGAVAADPPPGGYLTGRVVGPGGGPIAGATVGHGTGRGAPLVTSATGPDGRFKLGPLAPKAPSRFETLDLYADAPGLARGYVRRPAVVPGAANDVGDVRLEPGVVIRGRVAAPGNRPLAGATITVEVGRSDVGGRADFGPPLTTFTDAAGRYEIPPLPPGQHWLRFRAGGRETALEVAEVRPGPAVEFPGVTLEPMLDVSGTVVDDRCLPLDGADVDGGSDHRTRTDRDGRYTLAGYGTKDTNVRLTVRKPGYLDAEVAVGAVKPTVALKPVGGFDCRVVDADSGEAVARWAAALERVADGKPAERVWSSYGSALEPGRRVVYAPDLGSFRLALYADGYDTDRVSLPPLTERKVAAVPVIKLKKTDPTTHARVEGVAERGGKPIANGWAALYLPYEHVGQPVLVVRGRVVPPAPHFRSETPVRDGRFTLPAPRPGEDYTVGVFEANRPPVFLSGVAVKAGQATRVKLTAGEPGAVAGSVGSWPAGWGPHLRVVAFDRLGFTFEAAVAGDGTFRFTALPPGEYGLKAGHDAYNDSDRPARALGPAGDPWARAVRVRVKPGEAAGRIELEVTEK